MKSSAALPFRKTAECPASATLLSFRADSLPASDSIPIKEHLEGCDFCRAELPLLAHHNPADSVPDIPEMPVNLRILAESLLSQKALNSRSAS